MKSLSIQNCQAFNLDVTGLGIRFRESCQSGATATEKKKKKKDNNNEEFDPGSG